MWGCAHMSKGGGDLTRSQLMCIILYEYAVFIIIVIIFGQALNGDMAY